MLLMCLQAGSGADPRQTLEEPQLAFNQQEQAAVSSSRQAACHAVVQAAMVPMVACAACYNSRARHADSALIELVQLCCRPLLNYYLMGRACCPCYEVCTHAPLSIW